MSDFNNVPLLGMDINKTVELIENEGSTVSSASVVKRKAPKMRRRRRYVYSKPKKKKKKKDICENLKDTVSFPTVGLICESKDKGNHSDCSSDTIIDDLNEDLYKAEVNIKKEFPDSLLEDEHFPPPELGRLLISDGMLLSETKQSGTRRQKGARSKSRARNNKSKGSRSKKIQPEIINKIDNPLLSIKYELKEASEPPTLPVKESANIISEKMVAFPRDFQNTTNLFSASFDVAVPESKKRKPQTARRGKKKQNSYDRNIIQQPKNNILASDDYPVEYGSNLLIDESVMNNKGIPFFSNVFESSVTEMSKAKMVTAKKRSPAKRTRNNRTSVVSDISNNDVCSFLTPPLSNALEQNSLSCHPTNLSLMENKQNFRRKRASPNKNPPLLSIKYELEEPSALPVKESANISGKMAALPGDFQNTTNLFSASFDVAVPESKKRKPQTARRGKKKQNSYDRNIIQQPKNNILASDDYPVEYGSNLLIDESVMNNKGIPFFSNVFESSVTEMSKAKMVTAKKRSPAKRTRNNRTSVVSDISNNDVCSFLTPPFSNALEQNCLSCHPANISLMENKQNFKGKRASPNKKYTSKRNLKSLDSLNTNDNMNACSFPPDKKKKGSYPRKRTAKKSIGNIQKELDIVERQCSIKSGLVTSVKKELSDTFDYNDVLKHKKSNIKEIVYFDDGTGKFIPLINDVDALESSSMNITRTYVSMIFEEETSVVDEDTECFKIPSKISMNNSDANLKNTSNNSSSNAIFQPRLQPDNLVQNILDKGICESECLLQLNTSHTIDSNIPNIKKEPQDFSNSSVEMCSVDKMSSESLASDSLGSNTATQRAIQSESSSIHTSLNSDSSGANVEKLAIPVIIKKEPIDFQENENLNKSVSKSESFCQLNASHTIDLNIPNIKKEPEHFSNNYVEMCSVGKMSSESVNRSKTVECSESLASDLLSSNTATQKTFQSDSSNIHTSQNSDKSDVKANKNTASNFKKLEPGGLKTNSSAILRDIYRNINKLQKKDKALESINELAKTYVNDCHSESSVLNSDIIELSSDDDNSKTHDVAIPQFRTSVLGCGPELSESNSRSNRQVSAIKSESIQGKNYDLPSRTSESIQDKTCELPSVILSYNQIKKEPGVPPDMNKTCELPSVILSYNQIKKEPGVLPDMVNKRKKRKTSTLKVQTFPKTYDIIELSSDDDNSKTYDVAIPQFRTSVLGCGPELSESNSRNNRQVSAIKSESIQGKNYDLPSRTSESIQDKTCELPSVILSYNQIKKEPGVLPDMVNKRKNSSTHKVQTFPKTHDIIELSSDDDNSKTYDVAIPQFRTSVLGCGPELSENKTCELPSVILSYNQIKKEPGVLPDMVNKRKKRKTSTLKVQTFPKTYDIIELSSDDDNSKTYDVAIPQFRTSVLGCGPELSESNSRSNRQVSAIKSESIQDKTCELPSVILSYNQIKKEPGVLPDRMMIISKKYDVAIPQFRTSVLGCGPELSESNSRSNRQVSAIKSESIQGKNYDLPSRTSESIQDKTCELPSVILSYNQIKKEPGVLPDMVNKRKNSSTLEVQTFHYQGNERNSSGGNLKEVCLSNERETSFSVLNVDKRPKIENSQRTSSSRNESTFVETRPLPTACRANATFKSQGMAGAVKSFVSSITSVSTKKTVKNSSESKSNSSNSNSLHLRSKINNDLEDDLTITTDDSFKNLLDLNTSEFTDKKSLKEYKKCVNTHIDSSKTLENQKNLNLIEVKPEVTAEHNISSDEISFIVSEQDDISNQTSVYDTSSNSRSVAPNNIAASFQCSSPINLSSPVHEIMENSVDISDSISLKESDLLANFKKNNLKFCKHPYPGNIPFYKRKPYTGCYFRYDKEISNITVEDIGKKLKEAENQAPEDPADGRKLDFNSLIPEEVECYYRVLTAEPSKTLISKYLQKSTVSARNCNYLDEVICLSSPRTEDNASSVSETPKKVFADTASARNCNSVDDVLCIFSSPSIENSASSVFEVSAKVSADKSVDQDANESLETNKTFITSLSEQDKELGSTFTNDVIFQKGTINSLSKNVKNSQQLKPLCNNANVPGVSEINNKLQIDSHENITKGPESISEISSAAEQINLLPSVSAVKVSTCTNIFPSNNSKQSNKIDSSNEMPEGTLSKIDDSMLDNEKSDLSTSMQKILNANLPCEVLSSDMTPNNKLVSLIDKADSFISPTSEVESFVSKSNYHSENINDESLKEIPCDSNNPVLPMKHCSVINSIHEQSFTEFNVVHSVQQTSSNLNNLTSQLSKSFSDNPEHLLIPGISENATSESSINTQIEEQSSRQLSLQVNELCHSEKDDNSQTTPSVSNTVNDSLLRKLNLHTSELRKILETVNIHPSPECSKPNLLNFKETYQYDHTRHSYVSPQHVVDYGHGISMSRGEEYFYYDREPLIKIPIVHDYGHKSVKDLDIDNLDTTNKETVSTTIKARHEVSGNTPICSKSDLTPENNKDNFNKNSELPVQSSYEQQPRESEQKDEMKESATQDQDVPNVKPKYITRFQRVMARVSSKKSSKAEPNNLLTDCFPLKSSKKRPCIRKPMALVPPSNQKSTKNPPKRKKIVHLDNNPLSLTDSKNNKKTKKCKKNKSTSRSKKSTKSPPRNKSISDLSTLFRPDKIVKAEAKEESSSKSNSVKTNESHGRRVYGRVTNRGSFLTQSSINQPPKPIGKRGINMRKITKVLPDELHSMIHSPKIDIFPTSKNIPTCSDKLFKSVNRIGGSTSFIASASKTTVSTKTNFNSSSSVFKSLLPNPIMRPPHKDPRTLKSVSPDITCQSLNDSSNFLISPNVPTIFPNVPSKKSYLPCNSPLLPNPEIRPESPLISRRTLLPTPQIGFNKTVTDNEGWFTSIHAHAQNYSNPYRSIPVRDFESGVSLTTDSPSAFGSSNNFNVQPSSLTEQSSPSIAGDVHISNRSAHHRHSRTRQTKCVCLPPKSLKASIGNAVFDTADVLLLILEWNVDWLVQQQKNHDPPPISTYIKKVVNTYEDFDEYYNTYLPLMLLETWQRIYMSWTSLNQAASPYFCEVTSYSIECNCIKVQCQAIFKSSDAERGLVPEEGNIIMVKFGTKEKGGIKIFGYIRDVKIVPFDSSMSASFKYLKYSSGESLQMLLLTFSGAYSSDDFDTNQLIRIQILYNIKSTLKQNEALLNLKNSPLYKNILNPLTDGLRIVTLKIRNTDPVKDNASQCVRDIVKGILSPHPLPLLTVAKTLLSFDHYLILPSLIEMMKNSYRTKVLLCTRTSKALTDIGITLCGTSIKFVVLGKKSDIHQKLRKYLLEEVANKKLSKESSEDALINEDTRNSLLVNIKLDILKNCDVILSLIRNCHNELVAEAYADGDSIARMCCIIDEAGACTEPEILIPLLYGISKLILIGDTDVPAKVCSKAAANFGRLDRALKAEVVGKDLRGQAEGSSWKTSENLVYDVKQYSQRFPQFESHYTRNHNPGRKYLNPELNVYLSTRSGTWVLPKVGPRGLPFDMILLRKHFHTLKRYFNSTVNSFLEKKFQHEVYNLKPNHRVLDARLIMNDIIPDKILTGRVLIKGNIKKFEENAVVFEGEQTAQEIDVVIFATGYEMKIPILDDKLYKTDESQFNLYKKVFPLGLKHSTLAVIGFVECQGPTSTVAESQSRWAARIFSGKLKFPSEDILKERLIKKVTKYAGEDYMEYMNELAEEYGVKPYMSTFLFKDFYLFWSCFTGPFTSYQYRLSGPHKWNDARKAIFECYDRVTYPLSAKLFSGKYFRSKSENEEERSLPQKSRAK
ncbi:Dimethylaniline monooxygenase [N-oxide-forming] like protein [Argiope bruennichi]|uniref:Flavin-containing monooxygenase n=1 Tax=Argiope bruennichi TaxID=94029 RepID=A0A8T0FIV9_ARGBR|nr:Dimethylaniline monooxygenase [N-oxide-forming] like protein [Argiope bruennichi]